MIYKTSTMISNKVFVCIFCFFVMGIIYMTMQMFFLLPKLRYSDISQAAFRAQTSMEHMGPIRPNIITKWTVFQAKEHPEQYDMDDGIVVVKEEGNNREKKNNLRSNHETQLYSDSVIVNVGKDVKLVEMKPKSEGPLERRVRVDLYMESLCPDTHYFIKNSLSKVTRDAEIMAITDLRMYIFGKGIQISRDPPKFNCQHGEAECYGNLVENCIVKHSTAEIAISIMICLHERLQFDQTSVQKCTDDVTNGKEINKAVMQCITTEGDHLLLRAYMKTPGRLTYVPSMRINKGTVMNASNTIKEMICSNYKGIKPSSCP